VTPSTRRGPPLDLTNRLALRPAEVAEVLGLSKRMVDSLIRRQVLPTLRVGTAVLVPLRPLERWLDQEAEAQQSRIDDLVREGLRAVNAPLDSR
jgi:excisionase family DNA binding protein